MKLKQLVDRVIHDGVITEAERCEIARLVTADPEVTEEERREISRLANLIDTGEVRVVADGEQAGDA